MQEHCSLRVGVVQPGAQLAKTPISAPKLLAIRIFETEVGTRRQHFGMTLRCSPNADQQFADLIGPF
jgi:hypothetical protein